ncbi:MAG TPA: Clp protease N-terminal domain-containing protein, partial [Candidatus Rubrimentiphilum sp.]|nr:Clp protease N-terminal domain-containing protein [Candidatus Rubrimentiphilum sp.]
MWEPFSEQARTSIIRAQEAAQRLGQNYIGTEHLLLGVIALPNTAGTKLLQSSGIDCDVLKDKIEGTLRRKEPALQEMVFTPRAKRAIELAFQEAHELHDTYIGTEHLLLGIVAESESHAAQALLELGASRDALKAKLTDEIREETPTAKHGDAFIAYDHVQLAMPAGREAEARDF